MKPKSLHLARRYGFRFRNALVDQAGNRIQIPAVYIDGGYTESAKDCRKFADWLLRAAEHMEAENQ